jgi:hypothetical protein
MCWDNHLLPVRNRRGEVHELESRFRLRSSRPANRVCGATAFPKSIEAWLSNGADHMNEESAGRVCLSRERACGRPRRFPTGPIVFPA